MSRGKQRHRRVRINADDAQAFRARTAAQVVLCGGVLMDARPGSSLNPRSQEQMRADIAEAMAERGGEF